MRIFNFVSHISHMGSASGKKRIAYAIANALIVALAFASCYGIYYFSNHLDDSVGAFFGGIVGIVLCVAIAVTSFLQGVIAQLVLTVMSLIGTFVSEEKLANFIAFFLTLVSYVAVVVVIIVLS